MPPEPDAVRVLGCILQLGNVPDAARFWWQFAAGADDHIAAYCLALQHQSLGEDTAAAWWMDQTPGATDPDEHLPFEPDRIPTFTGWRVFPPPCEFSADCGPASA
ncbi:hypothetical protein [Streptomyces sp. NPDC029674]|uniref:hypothetical protein n=1 Tax=Streptomyces sp. NPDC029674 TaxID=3365297 RepID=UPI00384CDD65